MASAYNKRLQQLVREFIAEEAHNRSFTKNEVARWALSTGRVKHPAGEADRLIEKKVAHEFAEAMREDYGTDAQGRVVREMYAARVAGQTRWNSRRHGGRSFLEMSAVQQREQIVGHCRRLKVDVDSLNDNRWPENPIQMSFDFRPDLAELEAGEQAERDKKAS